MASGARWRAGFGHFRHQFAYNVRIPRAQEILGVERTVHTAEHLASAMFYLGAPVGEVPRARLSSAGKAKSMPHRCHHPPGGRDPARRPGARKDSWRSRSNLRQAGIEPVFIGAAGDDLSPFAGYRTLAGAPLGEVKALLARSCLFVGNDSGPAHMAAAFGLPVVVIFGNSDPAIWAPWRTAAEIVTAPGGIARVSTGQVWKRWRACGCMHEGTAAPARVCAPLLGALVLAVVLMAAAGGANGVMALLIGPILYNALDPRGPDRPVKLYTDPIFHHVSISTNSSPAAFTTLWSWSAFAILAVFLLKGVCDYFGNYLVNYVGFSAVTDLRNRSSTRC